MGRDKNSASPHDRAMELSSTLSWLVDAAADSAGANRFLAELGAHLIADGLPLAGGALTLDTPHPLVARRTWLWRADNGEVIEALGFAPGLPPAAPGAGRANDAGRRWLATIAAGPVHEDAIGPGHDGPLVTWIGPRPFTSSETNELHAAARFAAAPLAVLAARATLTAALEAYLGRRSAARVLAAPLRRNIGETIQAALLYADLRGFTPLSDSNPPALVISALDAWFDRIAGAIHAFGGEVLKFIGDGILAIFPVVGGTPRGACDAALRRCPPRASAWHISMSSGFGKGCRRYRSAPLCILARFSGAISARRIAWISPPSAPQSIWSAGWRGCANRWARRSSCPARLPPRRRHR
jgi:adenylate cyclase